MSHPIDTDTDWEIAVELQLPTHILGRWGGAVWGTDQWNGPDLEWYDITEYVRGMMWTRGTTEFDGRPEIGIAEITLDNTGGQFSPIDPTNSFEGCVATIGGLIYNNYFRAGNLIRIIAI